MADTTLNDFVLGLVAKGYTKRQLIQEVRAHGPATYDAAKHRVNKIIKENNLSPPAR